MNATVHTVCTIELINPSLHLKLISNNKGKWLFQAPVSLSQSLSITPPLRLFVLAVSYNMTVSYQPGGDAQLTWYMALPCSLYHTTKSSLIPSWLTSLSGGLIHFLQVFSKFVSKTTSIILNHPLPFFPSHFSVLPALLSMGNDLLYSLLHLPLQKIWKVWGYFPVSLRYYVVQASRIKE